MNKDIDTSINYPKLVDDAMRGIVKNLLKKISVEGITGDHYFLITFLTNAIGVKLSDRVKKRYRTEMTIILQHQYESLHVNDSEISVRLSFDSIKENVVIPFTSLTAFVDPSTRFALQFNQEFALEAISDPLKHAIVTDNTQKSQEDTLKDHRNNGGKNNTNVIDLSQFRKKNDK